MKKNGLFFIIIGILFIFISLIELILCFYGPIILDVKSTIFVFPLYTVKEEPETNTIKRNFCEQLEKSRKYIVIKGNYAESILAQEGISRKEITTFPSVKKYAEVAKLIGAEKFIMGYILKTKDRYELFINIHLTKLAESVIKEKLTAPDADALIRGLPGFIVTLDGGEKTYSLPEVLYLYALLFHALFGIFLIGQVFLPHILHRTNTTPHRIAASITFRTPEILFIYTLLLFIFSYIYALNANMDYVQKFIATGGKLHLAQSTAQERINTGFRYFPLLALSGFYIFWTRLKRKKYGLADKISPDFRVLWALPLTIISALFTSLSLPSFLDINGWPVLGFFCLIPFFLVIEKNSCKACIFYGIIFGIFNTVFTSYWLGTFDLVSLQIVMLIFLISYTFFMIPATWLYKRAGYVRFLVFPAAWVVFDYLQSLSFAGYPWGMVGVSQYGFIPLIQVSALTGIWGITFIVIMANAVLAHTINSLLDKKRKGFLIPLTVFGGIFCVVLAGGLIYCVQADSREMKDNGTVRIAQIQDSLDPRKHRTHEVMEELITLTNSALKEKPDLVVWPEGSFDLDYLTFPDSLFSKDLRNYQQTTGTWLLTGSIEYKNKKLALKTDEHTDMDSYNSSMLLTPEAEVIQSYHKIHLVPFTEYFPYEKELPWMYKMLKDFDINWWEKGDTRVIFEHPQFTFFTPICYEDVFPGEIALFVKDGADVIMNLSNDFWSLSPVEGKQHAMISLFRAVENARPLLRTTTSGLTCYIDKNGRIKKSLPYYEPGYYVVDVPLPGKELTFYTQTGDWFPWFLLIGLGILCILSFIPWMKSRLSIMLSFHI